MVFKRGTIKHAKGFIINKLFKQRRYGGGHIPVFLLDHGYQLNHRHLIPQAVDELRKEGLVLIQPKRTGKDSSDHITLLLSKLSKARALLNGYREREGLPRYGRDFRTLLPVK